MLVPSKLGFGQLRSGFDFHLKLMSRSGIHQVSILCISVHRAVLVGFILKSS